MNNPVIETVFILNILLFLAFPCTGSADSSLVFESENYSIQWSKQLYRSTDIENDRSFLSKLSNLVFGDDIQIIHNPVDILTLDLGRYLILDQHSASLHLVSEEQELFSTYPLPDLISPVSMALLSPDRILITDAALNQVYSFHLKNEELSPFRLSQNLNRPTGIAVIPGSNHIWISETSAHHISIFDINGNFIKAFGSRGTSKCEFNYPTFIFCKNENRIIINDTMNFRVQILDTCGSVISVFGEAGSSSGYLARPKGIACDTFGHIYIVDAIHSNVQVFNPTGDLLAYFGSRGRDRGEFWLPTGISIDDENNIYVADTYNSRIQVFKLESRD